MQLLVNSPNDTAVTEVVDRTKKAPATSHEQETTSPSTAKRKAPAAIKTNERHSDPPTRVKMENRVFVHQLHSEF